MSKSIGRRSKSKAIYVAEGVIRALNRHEKDQKNIIKIWSRASVIIPRFVGKTVSVYNGMKWVSFLVSDYHVNHKFGEFSPTRVPVKHSGTKQSKGKKK